MNNNRCEPCEISTAGAIILSRYTGTNKSQIKQTFSKGKMSVTQLLKQTNADNELISLIDSFNVPQNLTLEEATKNYNIRKGVK